MKNNSLLNALVLLALSVLLIIACKVQQEGQIAEPVQEVADTGALVIESSPSLAAVYIGEEYRGDTPINLFNLPVGQYEITIKKEGFADFKKTISIKVGRTEELDVTLTPLTIEVEEKKIEQKEKMPETMTPKLNKINLSSFAMYFDFENMQFTETRTEKSDLFSRKYDNYVHFSALTPAKINAINKPIKEIQKEDCIFADVGVASLFAGQTLCVKTAEGAVVAIGWQTTIDELEWALLD